MAHRKRKKRVTKAASSIAGMSLRTYVVIGYAGYIRYIFWYIKWSDARRRVIADFVLYIHGQSLIITEE